MWSFSKISIDMSVLDSAPRSNNISYSSSGANEVSVVEKIKIPPSPCLPVSGETCLASRYSHNLVTFCTFAAKIKQWPLEYQFLSTKARKN